MIENASRGNVAETPNRQITIVGPETEHEVNYETHDVNDSSEEIPRQMQESILRNDCNLENIPVTEQTTFDNENNTGDNEVAEVASSSTSEHDVNITNDGFNTEAREHSSLTLPNNSAQHETPPENNDTADINQLSENVPDDTNDQNAQHSDTDCP